MFRQVFDPDNLFWRLISRGVDFVGLGLFWLVLCVPIVTIGPASSALYYAVVKGFRQKEIHTFLLMWNAFRENVKKGCLATLISLPFCALFVFFYGVMEQAKTQGNAGAMMFVAYWVALLVPAGILCWLFPIMARFEATLKESFRTAALIALRHLPSTFIIVLLNMYITIFTLERWWPLFFTPVLCHLLCSLFTERVFLKYLNEEEQAVLEGREPESEEEEFTEDE